ADPRREPGGFPSDRPSGGVEPRWRYGSGRTNRRMAPRPLRGALRSWRSGPARRGRTPGPAPSYLPSCRSELLQVRLDERVEVTVHHALDVSKLELGPVIVDHRIGLEDVGSYLASP